jgi:hypothetical protein
MKKVISLLLLSWAAFAFAGPTPDAVDKRFYPPDPEAVDVHKLPKLVNGLASGMAFMTARRVILKQGWTPLDLKKSWLADEEPDCGLLECALHRRGVVELQGCPTDMPVCVFYYRKGKSWLQLMATGEELKDLKVYYWSSQPPESESRHRSDAAPD